MIIIADSPRPHKRILQKGEWRDGGGGRGAAQTALRAVSAPFAHPPGGRLAGPALSRKPAKKAGQGRGSLSRRGNPAESPGIGPQARRRLRTADAGKACVPRLRRGGLRPSPSPVPSSPTEMPSLPRHSARRSHNPPPKTAKKRRPHRDGTFSLIFRFSPAWQGRRGCGRGSPHGPAPPPALCRRRG